ncbi:hypothetical protein GCM10009799_19270 [Nocardiopsis rhodophaea]|uniref:Uncharacterized protein n=1 Tax=Nocardiopsis rhodophaea TaxID=280238 RepID=A0ABN2SVY7_9ACTN
MLASEQRGDVAGQPPEHDIAGVDDVPLTLDIAGLRAECAHDRKPSQSAWPTPASGDGELVMNGTGRLNVSEGPAGDECADDDA